MVFNATFNTISVILWQSVLLVEETGENHRIVTSDKVTDKLDQINCTYYNTECHWLYIQ